MAIPIEAGCSIIVGVMVSRLLPGPHPPHYSASITGHPRTSPSLGPLLPGTWARPGEKEEKTAPVAGLPYLAAFGVDPSPSPRSNVFSYFESLLLPRHLRFLPFSLVHNLRTTRDPRYMMKKHTHSQENKYSVGLLLRRFHLSHLINFLYFHALLAD